MNSRIELPDVAPGAAAAAAPAPGPILAAGCASAAAYAPTAAYAPADGLFFADLPSPVSFFILRHGQSEGNSRRIFQGKLDFPLDAAGRAQAGTAGAWLARMAPDAIVSSPQARAAETARIVASACGGIEPILFDPLAEVDTGIFSGIDYAEAERRHPEIYGDFFWKSWDAVPGAESSESMLARALVSWARLKSLAAGGARRIVCVSHGGMIQWLVKSTFGVRSWLPLIPVSNCGISRYDIEPSPKGRPAFAQWSLINFTAPGSIEGTPPVF